MAKYNLKTANDYCRFVNSLVIRHRNGDIESLLSILDEFAKQQADEFAPPEQSADTQPKVM